MTVLGGCALAFIVSSSLDLVEEVHNHLNHLERFQADEVFSAFAVATVGLIWYSHRRLVDYRAELARRTKAEASLTLTEHRLADAIESMSDGLLLLDSDLRFVMCNQRYREFYPQTSPLLTPGTPVAEIVRSGGGEKRSHDGVPTIDAALMKVIDSGLVMPEQDYRLAPDRWIRASDRPTREGGLVGIRTDITYLKRNEEALTEASRRAEAANLAKSQFLANMSHELRSPLNAVIGFSEMIELQIYGPLGNPKYKEYVHDIRESGQHLLSLINDILDLSKIEADKYVLNLEPLSVPNLLRACLHHFRLKAEEAGVRLEFTGGEVPVITADERAVRQVMINLLSNAIKFTPSGGTITLDAGVEDRMMTISVTDTGEGIPAADLPRIGQPFEQSVKPHALQKEGTGLGLALSRRLVGLHGGTLEIQSREGEGTRVTVRLPITAGIEAA